MRFLRTRFLDFRQSARVHTYAILARLSLCHCSVGREALPREVVMGTACEIPQFEEDLTQLRLESLDAIALLASVIGYGWLALLIHPTILQPVPVSAWIGGGLLALSGWGSRALKDHHSSVCTYLVVWSILGSVACAVLAFPSATILCLYVVPIVFASALLGQRAFFLVATVAGLLALITGPVHMGMPLLSLDIVLPVVIIALVTVASRLSVHNLYTMLAWLWHAYGRARDNEQTARQRGGELRRALKALDEATHRLERANYTSTLARDQAEEARRLKQQFVQTISHELRTPLNLIAGFTELMAHSPEHYGGQLPLPYLRDLGVVYRNVRHLQTLVNDVLDLARIEATQMPLVPEDSDPTALVKEAMDTASSLVEARGLTLHTEIESDLPRLRMDSTRIRQVMFNLLNNAARFTENGGVTVSVRRQMEEVVFAVADTGLGIAPEDIPRIFNEFQQVDGSGRLRHGGAGLGLAISRQFVEMHGGRMWVESEVGQGSTFYFSLPVGRADLIKDPGDQSETAMSTRPVSGKGSQQPVLLAVTRSPSAGALLKRHLRGCQVVVIPQLERARETAQDLLPQVVVIDRVCGELGSSELEELGHAWGLPQLTFVVCPLPGEERLHKELRLDGYLVKPVSRQELWDVLRPFGEQIDAVLLVDDDHDFVRMLTRMLDSPVRRYRAITAYSGQEALASMRIRRPDLVLLDLMMPDMNGFEVVRRIRSNPAWQQIPVIVISAQDELDHQKALTGTMAVARADGLLPSEVVRYLQNVVNMVVTPSSAPPAPRATPAA